MLFGRCRRCEFPGVEYQRGLRFDVAALHFADEGTDTMEQEKEFLLASKEGRLVYWIDDALRTLYKEPERFGVCAECGSPIGFERLDIVPWARLCVNCQRAEEERFGEAA